MLMLFFMIHLNLQMAVSALSVAHSTGYRTVHSVMVLLLAGRLRFHAVVSRTVQHCQALTRQPMLLQVQQIQHPFLDAVSDNLAIIASMHEEGIGAHLSDEGSHHFIA